MLEEIACRLWWAGYHAFDNTLCAKPTGRQLEYYQRCKHPKLGDFVMEMTNRGCEYIYRVGVLKKITGTNGEGWIIELLNGDLQTWHNADFIAILENFRES